MPSDAKGVGIGKAVPLAHWKSLMPLVQTAPGPGQPIHRVCRIKASSLMVLPGELTHRNRKPRFQTARGTHLPRGCDRVNERSEPPA